MITRPAHIFLVVTVVCGAAIGASSCSLDTNGAIDVTQVSEFGSSSSSSSSSGEPSSSSSSSSGSMGGSGGSGGGGGAAGSGGMGGAGGSPCLGTVCNGMCVDTSTDAAHCGGCNMACGPGLPCQGGQCLVCTPGATQVCYSGPMGTQGVGECKDGTQTCNLSGMSWSGCTGEVLPGTEICGNALDEDCNGTALNDSGCLVNTNLVVRYFLDEAPSGKGPANALDSAPNPLDLPITYDGSSNQLAYASMGSGRGLEWLSANDLGVANAAIDNTKVKSMLDGKQKGTIEIVARVDAAANNHDRLLTIGTDGENRFSLGVYSTPEYSFMVNDSVAGRWAANFAGTGRAVIHVVLDTTQPIPTNRVTLYVNGMLQTSFGGTAPFMNTTIALNTGASLCLGNRDTQWRSIDGALYYAALYADALSSADIATNVEILKAYDDK